MAIQDGIRRVALETLGCKLNQAESEDIGRRLAEAGCLLVGVGEEADIYILNTCTVTHIADRKSRQCLRQARRRNPHALLVALGCYAAGERDLLTRLGAGLILDNASKDDLIPILTQMGYLGLSGAADRVQTRTRSMVVVQDGCDRFCSYCIVPHVRGREKSYAADEIAAAVNRRVAEDYLEVVLTGTEIGAYNWNGIDLAGLIARVLDETSIRRLRVSSLQPQEVTPALLELWGDSRLCPHFHLSLQSGSDTVLRRMKRAYTSTEYGETLSDIRKLLPLAGITTDIIVGFPGETEQEFQQSLDFVAAMSFSRVHVFSYSPRRVTPAAEMPGHVDAALKKERSRLMRAAGTKSAAAFQQSLLGQPQSVLWEESGHGVCSGYSGNYVRMYAAGDEMVNRITPVVPVKAFRDGLWAEIR
jgi:threonylcarbamoyladenosine tRNA methylthiotransferase MtaB